MWKLDVFLPYQTSTKPSIVHVPIRWPFSRSCNTVRWCGTWEICPQFVSGCRKDATISTIKCHLLRSPGCSTTLTPPPQQPIENCAYLIRTQQYPIHPKAHYSLSVSALWEVWVAAVVRWGLNRATGSCHKRIIMQCKPIIRYLPNKSGKACQTQLAGPIKDLPRKCETKYQQFPLAILLCISKAFKFTLVRLASKQLSLSNTAFWRLKKYRKQQHVQIPVCKHPNSQPEMCLRLKKNLWGPEKKETCSKVRVFCQSWIWISKLALALWSSPENSFRVWFAHQLPAEVHDTFTSKAPSKLHVPSTTKGTRESLRTTHLLCDSCTKQSHKLRP